MPQRPQIPSEFNFQAERQVESKDTWPYGSSVPMYKFHPALNSFQLCRKMMASSWQIAGNNSLTDEAGRTVLAVTFWYAAP